MGPGREAGTRRLAQAICAQAAFSSRDLGAVSSPPPLSLRYLPLRYATFSRAASRSLSIASPAGSPLSRRKIGRASCRERVCQYVYISVVAVSLKKQNTEKHYQNTPKKSS